MRGSDWIRKGVIRKITDARSGKTKLAVEFYSMEQIDIVSVVAKELYESVEYKIEDDNV